MASEVKILLSGLIALLGLLCNLFLVYHIAPRLVLVEAALVGGLTMIIVMLWYDDVLEWGRSRWQRKSH